MMRAAALTLTLLGSSSAHAELIGLYLQGHGGYGGGSGQEETVAVAGSPVGERKDFFKIVNGPAAGVELGVKLFFLDAYGTFLRFLDGGTLSQLIAGVRGGYDGDDWNVYLRAGVGGMVGTFGDTDPRAAEAGETPMGVTARGGVGVGYKFGGVFSLGPQVDVGYYRLLNGVVQPDEDDVRAIEQACGQDSACVQSELDARGDDVGAGFETSSGVAVTALVALRATFGF